MELLKGLLIPILGSGFRVVAIMELLEGLLTPCILQIGPCAAYSQILV
jgi:hypothetical protein